MNKITVESKKDLLLYSLRKFYNEEKNLKILKPIISGKSNISLRVLDWFVTNYSKKFGTSYRNEENKKKNFIVYIDYKSQLKAYSKKQFDPFCRRERIIFKDNKNNEIITTVGQLNFFRWAIMNNIVDYIKINLEEIENDMIFSLKDIYKKEKGSKRRKRKELSISAVKTVKKHNVSIIVNFD
tara:strand:- start:53 stop:601 length:549 start_codon:yes stop_codon:yes gene_type:complete